MSFSIIYLCSEDTSILDETVKKHAESYDIPYFTTTSFDNLAEFVKNNIKTEYTFLAKQNTYINIKNVKTLLESNKTLQFVGYHPNKYDNF